MLSGVETQLFAGLLQQVGVLVAVAYALSRTTLGRRALGRLAARERVALTVVAAIMAIVGTYWGIEVNGALANTRVVGAMVAGLIGGPAAGLVAGLVGGVHRYFVGGFTALACGVSTTVEGLLGGLVRRWLGERAVTGWVGLIATAVAEVLQMVIILILARPLEDAIALVRIIALPMIIGNAVGVGLIMAIIRDTREQEDRVGALQAQKALDVANRTLPYLRAGFTHETAQRVAELIQAHAEVAAVSITDSDRILGFAGIGSDHHASGLPIRARVTREVLLSGRDRQVTRGEEVACQVPHCPLGPGVVVPLRDGERVIGTLHLYEEGRRARVRPVTVELALGLGQLLSTQIEVARLQSLAELAAQAELRALQAQINPHFLFNALNTVSVLCRLNPERSRQVIGLLSQYLRSSLRAADAEVSLQEELGYVEAYLSIEQTRFEGRLRYRLEIPPEDLVVKVPILSLQPLVENSVRHGLMPKPDGGEITVSARRVEDWLELEVADTGVGMDLTAPLAPKGHGIGLSNVRDRLRYLYGRDDLLTIESSPGRGTRIHLRVPWQAVEAEKAAPLPAAGKGGRLEHAASRGGR